MSGVAQSSLGKEFGLLVYWSIIGVGLGIAAGSLQAPVVVCLVALLPFGWLIAKISSGCRDAVVVIGLAAISYTYVAPAILGSAH